MKQLPLQVKSRVPCISLNAFAFPIKDTVVEKIFNALGGQELVKRAGGFSHLSMFYRSTDNRTNHVFVSCHNDICTVEFRRFSGPTHELVQTCENVPLPILPALFSDISGLSFSQPA